jgi:type II secretory pathway component GspD/PulD (secretin)
LVSYSLNIANSTSSNSQVIARPTLTALDRIPSTFYSGAVITAGLNGGGVSGAQITNIPTGVSLSVTPTFVDEESMMLAVKVSRSYVTSTSANLGGFSASISQDHHAVTANVKIKYGETLILDGLSSRVSAGGQDGVPVLQDIPIIQYFFNQKTQQQYSENVVVLVTPRKVQTEEEISKAASNAGKDQPLTNKEKSVYKALNLYKQITTESDTNLDNTLLALDRDSNYFRTFASSALNRNIDSWVSEPKIDKFFNDAANMIYFTR